MNKLSKSSKIGIIVGVLAFLSFVFVVINHNPTVVQGSVIQGSEYHSTTTDSTFTTGKVVNNVSGAVGSVVITTAGTGSITLYDATTTNASQRTISATTTIANFQVTTGVGTYIFDAIYYYGLIVQVSGTNLASTTVTYR